MHIPRQLLTICLLFFVPAGAVAQGPRALLPATSHDFGTVRQGEPLTHAFVIRNGGAAPLIIDRIDLSLPAMKARFRKTVGPGEEGRITIEWDTSPVNGEMEGEALVRTNDPAQPTLSLRLKAAVQPPIELLPMGAIFFSVFKDELAHRTIRVINHENRPLKISQVEPEGSHFRARLATVAAGKSYRLTVTAQPGATPGRYMEALYLHTDHPQHSKIRVPVNVFVKGDVYVDPPEVDFGTLDLGALRRDPTLLMRQSETFFVKRRGGPFEIVSVTSELPFVRVDKSPAGRSATFRFDVAVDPQNLVTGTFSGNIRIRTSDPASLELVVPVRGEVR